MGAVLESRYWGDVFVPTPSGNIYGVTWAGGISTALTRTDDAADFSDPVPYLSGASSYSSPFDDIAPWSGMVRVTDSTAGELVAIPKFWYKLTQSGTALTIQIANYEADGFSVSPAHMDRSDGTGERDIVYVGRYHCATSTYQSTTGVAQVCSVNRANTRTYIHNLGSTIWQSDFALRFTLWLLYIVEFADWNSQTKIGYGCSASGSKVNNGQTDSMPYHTGTTVSSQTSYGYTQYRYIEGLWDNVCDWMDGCYYSSSGMSVILNPSNFSDTANGTVIGTPSSGYPGVLSLSSAAGFPMFYPTATGGSSASYIPDNWNFSGSSPCLCVGGMYNQGLGSGLFYVYCVGTSGTNAGIGCRLMKLP